MKCIRTIALIAGIAAVLGLLHAVSLQNYLLFHTLTELFSVAVAFAIFLIAWNSRKFAQSSYFSFIGIAFLFIGSLDLLHTLAYQGMGVFQGYGANLATQLWVGARYLHSISFVLAAIFIKRRLRSGLVLGFFAFGCGLLANSRIFSHAVSSFTYSNDMVASSGRIQPKRGSTRCS